MERYNTKEDEKMVKSTRNAFNYHYSLEKAKPKSKWGATPPLLEWLKLRLTVPSVGKD